MKYGARGRSAEKSAHYCTARCGCRRKTTALALNRTLNKATVANIPEPRTEASDTVYIDNLAAQLTVNTMPEPTLKAFADHGKIGAARPMRDGDGGAVLKQFASAGVGVEAFSAQLQEQGAISFIKSWNDLFWVISSKSAVLRNAA